jgi:hypothetical protein
VTAFEDQRLGLQEAAIAGSGLSDHDSTAFSAFA